MILKMKVIMMIGRTKLKCKNLGYMPIKPGVNPH